MMDFMSNVQVIIHGLVSWYHELARLGMLRFWPCYILQLCVDIMMAIRKAYAYV